MWPPRISSAPASIRRPEDVIPVRDGLLPRAPGRADELVVKDGDAQRACWGFGQPRGSPAQTALVDAARLMAPGTHRIDTDDVQAVGVVRRFDRLPGSFEFLPRRGDTGRQRVGDVVIPRDGQDGRAELAEEPGRLRMLVTASAVRQIAAGDDERGRDRRGQSHPVRARGRRRRGRRCGGPKRGGCWFPPAKQAIQ